MENNWIARPFNNVRSFSHSIYNEATTKKKCKKTFKTHILESSVADLRYYSWPMKTSWPSFRSLNLCSVFEIALSRHGILEQPVKWKSDIHLLRPSGHNLPWQTIELSAHSSTLWGHSLNLWWSKDKRSTRNYSKSTFGMYCNWFKIPLLAYEY